MSKFINIRFHLAAGLASLAASVLPAFAPARTSTERRRPIKPGLAGALAIWNARIAAANGHRNR